MSGIAADLVQTYRLYPAAGFAIKSLGLPQAEEETIAYCVSRYSESVATGSNICDFFSWLVFRITNAFASIFGKSAWDNAEKVLHDRILQKASEQNGLLTINPQNDLDRKINLAVHIGISAASLGLLEAIYEYQYGCEDLTAQMKQPRSKDRGFQNEAVERLQRDVNLIRNGRSTPEHMMSKYQ